MQLVQSKNDVMRIVDDVLTLATLTSLYVCNEKKLGLKCTKFYVFMHSGCHGNIHDIHNFVS